MAADTVLIAIEAELASAALEATATQLRLTPALIGVVVRAPVGTVSELFAAVVFARQDKMDIEFSMCIGSAIQMVRSQATREYK
jgi:Ca2+:H+ antiporter